MTTNTPISKSDALKIAVIVGFDTSKDEIDNFDVSQGHYWDECDTCEEIKRLKLENIQLAHDLGECMAECDALKVKVAGDSIKNDGLNCANELNKNEIARLTRKLEKVENEREELRKTLGQVLDAANEIKRIGSFYGVD